MKLNAKDVIIPTLVLFLVSLLVTAALAGTNLLTKDQIKVQNELAAQASRKVVLPAAETFEEAPDKSYYIGKDAGGQTVGYVFSTQSNAGYGGAVGVMTGIASDGNVTGVVILSHNETPGLGFFLAMVLFAGIRQKLETCDIPKCLQGLPITLVAASLLAVSFLGFQGIVDGLIA